MTSVASPARLPVTAGPAGLTRTAAACALATVALALLAATIVLTLLDTGSKWWVAASPAVVVPLIAGLLIALYRPANAIGWLLLADAVNVAFGFVATPYAHYGLITNPGSLPGARWMLLWSSAGWPALFALPVALVLAFPDGRLPAPRWRPVAIAAVVSFAVLQIAVLFEPQNYVAPYTHITSPLPSLPPIVRTALTPFWLGAFASLFAAAWAMRARFRRAVGVERLQLLWLTYGALLIPLTLIACLVESAVGGTERAAHPDRACRRAHGRSRGDRRRRLPLPALRHRADLQPDAGLRRAHRRSGCGVSRALPRSRSARRRSRRRRRGRRRRSSRWGSSHCGRCCNDGCSGSSMATAPTPTAALARLGQRLQSAPDPSEVFTTIVDGVAGALRLGYCAVALRRDDTLEVAAEQGIRGREPQFVLPLSYQGDEIGELIAEPAPRSVLSATDRQLLEDLARQAGAAVHGVRVMSDLQRSRERLIAAREEERLRLRRDLHDGLGPTLAALVFKIGLIRDSVRDDPARSDRLLLRSSAARRGMRSPTSAVSSTRSGRRRSTSSGSSAHSANRPRLLSESTGLEITVASPDLPELPPAVEVAAYRIVTEALTNVTRHAQASRCDVELRLGDSNLELDVSDDGIGFADGARPGVGLRSMRERADELGGELRGRRGAACGTRIQIRLPVAP